MANLFSDGFESGDFSAWTSQAGADMTVTEGAALHGNYGASCLVDDTSDKVAYKNITSPTTRYRCRFYIDPNSITMEAAHKIYIFRCFTTAWTSAFFITLKYQSPYYYIYVYYRTDGGSYVNTTWVGLLDAPNCVEVDWTAATGAGNNDGKIQIWINGVLLTTKDDIDNDTLQVANRQDIGSISPSANISGTFYLDDFASNNDGSEIGLLHKWNTATIRKWCGKLIKKWNGVA